MTPATVKPETTNRRRRIGQDGQRIVSPKLVARRKQRTDAKEFALTCGYLLMRHFFGCENLHYGYWRPGVPVDIDHLRGAQEEFTAELFKQIPAGVHSILDVGCGTGAVAAALIERGHQVDCVSPGVSLTAYARQRLGSTAQVHECRFETLDTTSRYDAIMFCESFQYVNLLEALHRVEALLKPGGYLIIADFFRTEANEDSPLGGGHRLRTFYEEIARLPFAKVSDRDVTAEIAPTVELFDAAMSEVVGPIWELTQRHLQGRWPWTTRFAQWMLKRKIAKFERKHLSGALTAETFAKFKSYRFMVYQLGAKQ